MLRWLLGQFAVKPLFREDPFFNVSVDENPKQNLVRVKVELLGSSRKWRGKFRLTENDEFPLTIEVIDTYAADSDYFVVSQP